MTLQKIKDFIIKNRYALGIAGLFLLIIIFLVAIGSVLLKGKKITLPQVTIQNNVPSPSGILAPTLRPTPTPLPLVQGPQTYSISQKDAMPIMYEVYFSTIDPQKGGSQKVDLKVKVEKADITQVTAKIQTENNSFEKVLTLSSGNSRDGVWSGSWQINDAYDKKFMITFRAEDNAGNKSSVDVTIR